MIPTIGFSVFDQKHDLGLKERTTVVVGNALIFVSEVSQKNGPKHMFSKSNYAYTHREGQTKVSDADI